MKRTRKFLHVLLILGVLAALTTRAQDPLGPEKGAPPLKLGPGALGVLQKSSYNTGMLRRVGGSSHGVNGIMFTATGTMSEPAANGVWTEYKVQKLTAEMTYYTYQQGVSRSPGSRWDYSLIDTTGKMMRKIYAAAGGAAWDEVTPGGPATAVADAATYRLTFNWLTPQGLLWAALTPDGKAIVEGVKMSQDGGQTIISLLVNGIPASVRMDSNDLPVRVETRVKHPTVGDKPLELEYSDYEDIEVGYGVLFPKHIVEKLDGHTILNITVTEFHTNAYSVFPIPASVQHAAK
jgi:hypothetical protein